MREDRIKTWHVMMIGWATASLLMTAHVIGWQFGLWAGTGGESMWLSTAGVMAMLAAEFYCLVTGAEPDDPVGLP